MLTNNDILTNPQTTGPYRKSEYAFNQMEDDNSSKIFIQIIYPYSIFSLTETT